MIWSEVRSGQLSELLGDFGVSRIPVVDGGAAVGAEDAQTAPDGGVRLGSVGHETLATLGLLMQAT